MTTSLVTFSSSFPRSLPRALAALFFSLLILSFSTQSRADDTKAPTQPPLPGPLVAPSATPTSPALIPAARQANSLAVITIDGEIDAVLAASVQRRLQLAVDGKADAIVLEINSPGGNLGAVQEITAALRACPIQNTVAWIHPQALSGGAIIALSCREIVVSEGVQFGDAKPIIPTAGGFRGLTEDQRRKILPPLIAEVVSHARHHNDSANAYQWDEHIVTAIVVDDAQLWWIQDTKTGERFAVTKDEHDLLFPNAPPLSPIIATAGLGESATSGLSQPTPAAAVVPSPTPATAEPTPGVPALPEAAPASEPQSVPEIAPQPPSPQADAPPTNNALPAGEPADSAFLTEREKVAPASPMAQEQTSRVNEEIAMLGPVLPTLRPRIDFSDPGRYRRIAKLTSGDGPLTMSERDMSFLGFAANIASNPTGQPALAPIRNDQDLLNFFGASSLTRLEQSTSEHLARFLSRTPVRLVLLVGFLVCLFLEILHPGVSIPGLIAVGCLLLLFAPSFIIGVTLWWQLIAIALGVLCILVELLVLPGFGFFGVAGIFALLVGLVGLFIPQSNPLLPMSERLGGAVQGLVTVLLAFVTSGVVLYFIVKNLKSVPLLNRIVLQNQDSDTALPGSELLAMDTAPIIRAGDTGISLSPLRPAGKVEIKGAVYDVVCDLGFAPAGAKVRVLEVSTFRILVEVVSDQA